jgi:hypothetical protein
MLSVGPGAPRFAPSQDIHLKTLDPFLVIYITDNYKPAHNEDWQEADMASGRPHLTEAFCKKGGPGT